MRKRLALVALVLGAVVSSAALRGCWDPTEPDPWVEDGAAQHRVSAREVQWDG